MEKRFLDGQLVNSSSASGFVCEGTDDSSLEVQMLDHVDDVWDRCLWIEVISAAKLRNRYDIQRDLSTSINTELNQDFSAWVKKIYEHCNVREATCRLRATISLFIMPTSRASHGFEQPHLRCLSSAVRKFIELAKHSYAA